METKNNDLGHMFELFARIVSNIIVILFICYVVENIFMSV